MTNAPCTQPNCTRPQIAKGLCGSCYQTRRHAAKRKAARDALVRSCAHCGTTFSGRDIRAIYCSTECKDKVHLIRRGHIPLETLVKVERECEVCGKTFFSSKDWAKTCSKACSWKRSNKIDAANRKAARRETWLKNRKPCPECGAEVPLTDIGRQTRKYCSFACKQAAHARRWRERHPDYMRQYNYGLSPEEYAALLESQNGACAICGRAEWGKHVEAPCVDHDHETNAVRGILCGHCNRGLGYFRDDPNLLIAASRYLLKE